MDMATFQSLKNGTHTPRFSAKQRIAHMVRDHAEILASLAGEKRVRVLPRAVEDNETWDMVPVDDDPSLDPLVFGYDSYVIARHLCMAEPSEDIEAGASFSMALSFFESHDQDEETFAEPCVNIRLELLNKQGLYCCAKFYDPSVPFGFLLASFTEDALELNISREDISKAAIFIRQAQAVFDHLQKVTNDGLIGIV
ncbi:hypothetical protein RYA05_02345 [Pseudomonas syringae pv. actinidiae]|nr:hypothetical protein [Pseudomonas syringae pv. actinidiae]